MKMTIDALRTRLLAASGFSRGDGREGTVYEAIFPSDDTVPRYACGGFLPGLITSKHGEI